MKVMGIKIKQRTFFMEQVSVMKNINGHFYELKSVWELEEGISKDHNRTRKSQN